MIIIIIIIQNMSLCYEYQVLPTALPKAIEKSLGSTGLGSTCEPISSKHIEYYTIIMLLLIKPLWACDWRFLQ